jgi:hypothetical protein
MKEKIFVGHLKPPGTPMQNARKWFATFEIERMSQGLAWLDKAIRFVEKQIQEMNRKQRSKEQSEMSLVQCWRRHPQILRGVMRMPCI